MASAYPSALDTFATNHVYGQIIDAQTDNDQADSINKIEAELGTNPSGSYSTVKDRLDAGSTGSTILSPGAGVPQGSIGLGLSSSGFGVIEHRPVNTLGATLNIYATKDDATPTAALSAATGTAALKFGTDLSLTRGGQDQFASNDSLYLQPPMSSCFGISGSPTFGLWVGPQQGSQKGLDGNNITGGLRRVLVSGGTQNGLNGTARTGGPDSITSDDANGGGHVSFVQYEARNIDSGQTFNDKGSFHQFLGGLTVDPYVGGGDVYCEGLNFYGNIKANRKGAFIANMEVGVDISSGAQCRAVSGRFIINDSNTYSAYGSGSATFGASSRYLDSGPMAVEIISLGQPSGTGLQISGIGQGFRRALCVHAPGTTNPVSGIDGNGGVFTKTKAGAPIDADFRSPWPGMMIWDDTNDRLYVRKVSGVWMKSAAFTT